MSIKTGRSTESEAFSNASMAQGNDGISTLSFSLFGNNDLIPPSPDIDVNGIIQIGVVDLGDGGTEATISGSISGDGFPNNETFLSDQSGQSVFLNTFETSFGPNFGPAAGLLGNTYRKMGTIQPITIRFDQSGNIANIRYNGKVYSVEAWNALFTQNNEQ